MTTNRLAFSRTEEQLKVLFGLYHIIFPSILHFCLNKITSMLTNQLFLMLRYCCIALKNTSHGIQYFIFALQAEICTMYCCGLNTALSLRYQPDYSASAFLYQI